MKYLEIKYTSRFKIKKEELPNGFTLLEVIIVVLIISITALAGLPALNATLDHARLSSAAEEVVNALQWAQLSASSSGRETRVSIVPSADKIGVRQFKINADLVNGGDELGASDVESGSYEFMEYPIKKGVHYEIKLSDEDRFRGVDIIASDFDTSDPVYFDKLGRPSHGGATTIALGNYQIVVILDALTGRVSISD